MGMSRRIGGVRWAWRIALDRDATPSPEISGRTTEIELSGWTVHQDGGGGGYVFGRSAPLAAPRPAPRAPEVGARRARGSRIVNRVEWLGIPTFGLRSIVCFSI